MIQVVVDYLPRPFSVIQLGSGEAAMGLAVSIIIPAYNAGSHLARCLEAVRRLEPAPLECIIVNDGSTDDTAAIADRSGFRLISCGRRGPGFARNVGARAALGDVLLFIDSDVLLPRDSLTRILARFAEDQSRDAVIGSYDDRPESPDLISQYRNLLHCYMHQGGRSQAFTFWTGCGAIRTEAFRKQGGFVEGDKRARVEDIELGLRIRAAGGHIWLDKNLCVKHLKHWRFRQMIRTDVLDRAIPWAELILRFRSMPADLNLRWEQRISVLLIGAADSAALSVAVLAVAGMHSPASPWLAGAAAISVALLAALNRRFYRFLRDRKGAWFALRSFPVHCLYFNCAGVGFVLGALKHALSTDVPALAASLPIPSRREPLAEVLDSYPGAREGRDRAVALDVPRRRGNWEQEL